ncbi:MAG: YIP1 family protein [Bacteroidales bacterium]|nr:YIP1 family protein [Bacteroidales bacterium]
MNDKTFDFNLFIKESKETLLNPKSYFSEMKLSGGMVEPLIKAVIYGAIAGIFYFLWGIFRLSAGSTLIGGATGIMGFIWAVVTAIIGLFIGAVILLIISAICKGNTDFEPCLRVTASLMVIMPISAFFGFFTGISFTLGTIVNLIIMFYCLWLMYNALISALKANAGTVKIVTIVLAALFVLSILIGINTSRKVTRLLNENKELMEMNMDLQ